MKIVKIGNGPDGVIAVTNLMDFLFDEKKRQWIPLHGIVDELNRVTKGDRSLISAWAARMISFLALLVEGIRQIKLFQPWASTVEEAMAQPAKLKRLKTDWNNSVKGLSPLICQKTPGRTIALAIPADGRFDYPVNRSRNKKNTEAIRSAEQALDEFWTAYLTRLENNKAIPQSAAHIFSRTPQRTLDWIEPVVTQRATKDATQNPRLSLPFGGLSMTEKEKLTLPSKKDKVKTRGEASAQTIPATEADDATPQREENKPIFAVDKRALKVFGTLFFNPATSTQAPAGETAWIEFLHAMRPLGFLIEKLYGSVWQFTPTKLDVDSRSTSMSRTRESRFLTLR